MNLNLLTDMKFNCLAALIPLGLFGPGALAQKPIITSGGIVNAASYASPVSPESAVAVFGSNLSSGQQTAVPPLPTSLHGTSVTVNGIPAPLFFVSPGQVNIQIPASLISARAVSVNVAVTTVAGVSAPVAVPLAKASPGVFSVDGTGCGQAAILNVSPAGILSVNSTLNSAAPGDFVALFGTGIGTEYFPPPDGTPANGPVNFDAASSVLLDGQMIGTAYAGLAPYLVGADQLNFQIPPGTRESCTLPVTVPSGGLLSPTLSVSVHSGRGQCILPPPQSYGLITLTRTNFPYDILTVETDTLTAAFPAGPAVVPPAADTSLPVGTYRSFTPSPVSRICPDPGVSLVSAGSIGITSPSGTFNNISPVAQTDGVGYQQALPSGFLIPGSYLLSASGAPVSFQANAVIGAPVQVTTSLQPGTFFSASRPLTIRWTGGNPGSVVKVSLLSSLHGQDAYDVGYAYASAGSINFQPVCISPGNGAGTTCTFGIPSTSGAVITVETLPPLTPPVSFAAQGLTAPVQVLWDYKYVYTGISLGQ